MLKYAGEAIVLVLVLVIAGLHGWAIGRHGWNPWTIALAIMDTMAVLICAYAIYAAVRREHERLVQHTSDVLMGKRPIGGAR